jgi:hypothetical protein
MNRREREKIAGELIKVAKDLVAVRDSGELLGDIIVNARIDDVLEKIIRYGFNNSNINNWKNERGINVSDVKYIFEKLEKLGAAELWKGKNYIGGNKSTEQMIKDLRKTIPLKELARNVKAIKKLKFAKNLVSADKVEREALFDYGNGTVWLHWTYFPSDKDSKDEKYWYDVAEDFGSKEFRKLKKYIGSYDVQAPYASQQIGETPYAYHYIVAVAKDLVSAEDKNYDYYLGKWQKVNEGISKAARDLDSFLQDKGVNDLLESDTLLGDYHDKTLEPILKALHKVDSAISDYDHEVKKAVRFRKRQKSAAWPSKVKEGAVIKFFESADKKGRGMVMFAVNSNKDSAFWKKVKAGI